MVPPDTALNRFKADAERVILVYQKLNVSMHCLSKFTALKGPRADAERVESFRQLLHLKALQRESRASATYCTWRPIYRASQALFSSRSLIIHRWRSWRRSRPSRWSWRRSPRSRWNPAKLPRRSQGWRQKQTNALDARRKWKRNMNRRKGVCLFSRSVPFETNGIRYF